MSCHLQKRESAKFRADPGKREAMNSEPEADSDRSCVGVGLPAGAPPIGALRVVVVGASAGGLDALEKLFNGLPPDLGAAFVVIQHLSPDHKSMMNSLLARHTRMPVILAEDDMPIAPNQVHLIPPGSIMRIQRGRLRLTPKSARGLVLPIDIFLQSLASQNAQQAIVVILSGTGSDGARGAVAIHDAGGLLLAQDPDEAKFDGMPRSLIDTGLVDGVLPVEAMPARISAHLRLEPIAPGWRERISLDEQALALHPDAALSAILHLLLQLGGIDFDEYKTGTVLRRIERRMAARQLPSIQAYFELLNQDRAEAITLRHELLISVTSFFRDPDAYAALASQVVAPLVARVEPGHCLRVWCAGVSTGEEAYSIAMLFLEAFERADRWPSLKVFATDIEQLNIDTGAAGSYPESIGIDVSPERLQRFFHKRGNRFVVRSELRQCLVFARHNLLVDPPFTKMDLVVCRNALIYLRNGAQDKVLRRLQYALAPKGCLFLGSSESLGELQQDFQTLSARYKIWQLLRPSGALLDLRRTAASPHQVSLPGSQALHAQRLRRVGPNVVDQGQAALLKGFGPPPSVLVNRAQELVHAYGEVGPFLQIRDGQATLDIMRILAPALVPVAAALLFKSAREGISITADAVRLHEGGADGPAETLVRLSALPAGELDGQLYTLLVFERINLSERPAARLSLDLGSETSERLAALEHELAATRESLVATIEQLETTNEELESANEELQATNEEMMASNEELQSSNEELQSVNEELNTLNAEYEKKIDTLNRINADLDNLTKVVATSTLFVDEDLMLERFSPEAAKIFRLRDTDLGRPIEDLNHQLDYPDLFADLRATLASGRMLRKNVPGPAGRYFMVRMQPYNIALTSHRGVVLGLVEVTELYQALARLQEVMDALDQQVAVLDTEGRVLTVNRAWSEFMRAGAGRAPHVLPGQNYLEACAAATHAAPEHWARAAWQGVGAVLKGEREHFSMKYCHEIPAAPRWFALHASRLHGAQPGAVISHVDLSQAGCRPEPDADPAEAARA